MKSGGGGGGGGGSGGGSGGGGKPAKGNEGKEKADNNEKEMEEIKNKIKKENQERAMMMQMLLMYSIPSTMLIGLLYCLYQFFDGFHNLNRDDKWYAVNNWFIILSKNDIYVHERIFINLFIIFYIQT